MHSHGGILAEKATTIFGDLSFGKDGKIRPNFYKLPENKPDQELAVGKRFLEAGAELVGENAVVNLLPENDQDFVFTLASGAEVEVQCTEVVLRDFTSLVTVQEYQNAPADPNVVWMQMSAEIWGSIAGEGMVGKISIESCNGVIAKKIEKKATRYPIPRKGELWLIVFSVCGYPIGNFFRSGELVVSEPMRRARALIDKNGPGPFTRIFFFDLNSRPEVIWPLKNPS